MNYLCKGFHWDCQAFHYLFVIFLVGLLFFELCLFIADGFLIPYRFTHLYNLLSYNKRATTNKWQGKKRPSTALINSWVEQTDSYIQFTGKDWTVDLLLSWPTCRIQIQTNKKALKSTEYCVHCLHCFFSQLVKLRLHMISQPYPYCCISVADFSLLLCCSGKTDDLFPLVAAGIFTTVPITR